jgi:hypothetical protein
MSSLQKFHRRTNNMASVVAFPYSPVGNGDATVGFWLGTAGDGTSKLIVAPKSTESKAVGVWGSVGTARGTTSTTNGLANTNTLYSFGSTAHPQAYYCKTLTTGGYNTWYQPAMDELSTLFYNKTLTPFSFSNGFVVGTYYQSSTEADANQCKGASPGNPSPNLMSKNYGAYYIRAVRKSL